MLNKVGVICGKRGTRESKVLEKEGQSVSWQVKKRGPEVTVGEQGCVRPWKAQWESGRQREEPQAVVGVGYWCLSFRRWSSFR